VLWGSAIDSRAVGSLWFSQLVGHLKSMTHRAMRMVFAASLLMASVHSALAGSPAELISNFRLQHGEVRVTSDATLNRIALEQARAMAAKEKLDHGVLGSFSTRMAPSRAGRAAENIAYGYDNFEKTLGQWIASSEHRKNLLLHKATRIGVASAKDASGRRTYWAMEIAGDYEPPPSKGKKKGEKVEQVASSAAPSAKRKPAASKCHINLLGLCI
jgi:Cysteine-rich secretory protein family